MPALCSYNVHPVTTKYNCDDNYQDESIPTTTTSNILTTTSNIPTTTSNIHTTTSNIPTTTSYTCTTCTNTSTAEVNIWIHGGVSVCLHVCMSTCLHVQSHRVYAIEDLQSRALEWKAALDDILKREESKPHCPLPMCLWSTKCNGTAGAQLETHACMCSEKSVLFM